MTPTCYLPVLSVLFGVNRKFKKHYCFPSQIKILALLNRFHNIARSPRTINRWLRQMEDNNLIRRRRRIKKDPVFGMMFQSTLYLITTRGYKLLYAAGVDCWDILKKFLNKPKHLKPGDDQPDQEPIAAADIISGEERKTLWKKLKASAKGNLAFFFSV